MNSKYVNIFNYVVLALLFIGIFLSKVIPSPLKPWLLGLIIVIEAVRFGLKYITKKSFKSETKLVFTLLILFVFFSFLFFEVRFRNLLNNINQDFDSYDVHFVSTENLSYASAKEFDGQTIGLLSDETSLVSHQFPKEIIEENELSVEWVYYEDYYQMISALNNDLVDLIVLPGDRKSTRLNSSH